MSPESGDLGGIAGLGVRLNTLTRWEGTGLTLGAIPNITNCNSNHVTKEREATRVYAHPSLVTLDSPVF